MKFILRSFGKKRFIRIAILLFVSASMPVAAIQTVRMQTDLGGIDIELFDTEAPITFMNFMNYVNDGDYDGTFFHRSVAGFALQGGGYVFSPENGSLLLSEGDRSGEGSSLIPTDDAIPNEPDPVNRPNVRGTIAMAKGSNANSATSQWFFNLADNPTLDNPNNAGGFTVFGRVVGDGMNVIDAIAAIPRCQNMLSFPTLCGPGSPSTVFKEMPLTGMYSDNGLALFDHLTANGLISRYNIVEIQTIGFDSDGDGIIDKVEDAGSNNGDANMDGVSDSVQQNIATFKAASGSQVILESTAGTLLESTDVLGQTFALSTYGLPINVPSPLPAVIDGFEFAQGYVRYKIRNVQPGAGVVTTYTVAGVVSKCQLANTFFNYGPTPDNASPHWYAFDFDGETGAEISEGVVLLNYVDGKRGDSDLLVNGVIATAGGPASITDDDEILSEIEDGAENDGDGNNDGICDSAQSNVLSLPDLSGEYVTLEIDEQLSLGSVQFIDDLEVLSFIFSDAKVLQGFNLQHDVLSFSMTLAGAGDSASVKIVLPQGESPSSFFKYGPTPDNADPHWYEFLFDGETGAEINGNEITLYFVDGKRGDSDIDDTNGIILDPGAPVFKVKNSGSGSSSGGGCSLSVVDRSPVQAGAWWLMLTIFGFIGAWRYGRKQ